MLCPALGRVYAFQSGQLPQRVAGPGQPIGSIWQNRALDYNRACCEPCQPKISMEKTMSEPINQEKKKTSFLATMGAIFWSFIGLRRRSDYENDVTGLNPFYVLIAALIGLGIFIAILLTAVSFALK